MYYKCSISMRIFDADTFKEMSEPHRFVTSFVSYFDLNEFE